MEIDRLQPQLNALIAVDDDLAVAASTALDAELKNGIDRGALHGIPIVVKDDTDVAGYPTTVGSALYKAPGAARIAERDAAAVARLKAAGAVILGKANMKRIRSRRQRRLQPAFREYPKSLVASP